MSGPAPLWVDWLSSETHIYRHPAPAVIVIAGPLSLFAAQAEGCIPRRVAQQPARIPSPFIANLIIRNLIGPGVQRP